MVSAPGHRSPIAHFSITQHICTIGQSETFMRKATAPSGIVLAPDPLTGVTTPVSVAMPMVLVDRGSADYNAIATVATDNLGAGRKAALSLVPVLHKGARVAVLRLGLDRAPGPPRCGVRAERDDRVRRAEGRRSDARRRAPAPGRVRLATGVPAGTEARRAPRGGAARSLSDGLSRGRDPGRGEAGPNPAAARVRRRRDGDAGEPERRCDPGRAGELQRVARLAASRATGLGHSRLSGPRPSPRPSPRPCSFS